MEILMTVVLSHTSAEGRCGRRSKSDLQVIGGNPSSVTIRWWIRAGTVTVSDFPII